MQSSEDSLYPNQRSNEIINYDVLELAPGDKFEFCTIKHCKFHGCSPAMFNRCVIIFKGQDIFKYLKNLKGGVIINNCNLIQE